MKTILRAVAFSLSMAGVCHAQPYPNQPVHVIVPFAAGGPTDVVARILQPL